MRTRITGRLSCWWVIRIDQRGFRDLPTDGTNPGDRSLSRVFCNSLTEARMAARTALGNSGQASRMITRSGLARNRLNGFLADRPPLTGLQRINTRWKMQGLQFSRPECWSQEARAQRAAELRSTGENAWRPPVEARAGSGDPRPNKPPIFDRRVKTDGDLRSRPGRGRRPANKASIEDRGSLRLTARKWRSIRGAIPRPVRWSNRGDFCRCTFAAFGIDAAGPRGRTGVRGWGFPVRTTVWRAVVNSWASRTRSSPCQGSVLAIPASSNASGFIHQ